MEDRWAHREKGWSKDVIETVGLIQSVEKGKDADKKERKGKKE